MSSGSNPLPGRQHSQRAAALLYGAAAAGVIALHLATNSTLGFHTDELYYLTCGLHPALGYVDFPPLVPLLARLETGLLGVSPWTLRVLPSLLGGFLVALSGLYVRRLGGSLRLQGIALLSAVAAASFFLGARAGRTPIPSFQRLTFRRGFVWSARFAPDGQTVVYGAGWEGKPVQLFSTRPGNPESVAFPLPGADVMAISSSGELALLLGRHFIDGWESSGTLARMPLSGNAPREVLENVLAADWAPNGADLAVVRIVGQRMRLEYPIGHSLYETSGWIGAPRVSPAGDSVAFLEHPLRGDDP